MSASAPPRGWPAERGIRAAAPGGPPRCWSKDRWQVSTRATGSRSEARQLEDMIVRRHQVQRRDAAIAAALSKGWPAGQLALSPCPRRSMERAGASACKACRPGSQQAPLLPDSVGGAHGVSQGLITSRPISAKSATSRVASVAPWARAVAAITASAVDMDRPNCSRRVSSWAYQ